MCRTNRSSWGASRERERERQRWWRCTRKCEWERLIISPMLFFPSLFSAWLHSLGARRLFRSRLFGCTLLNLLKWNCCALAEILRQCHITYQNVQHLYIVQLWAEGEMCGWDVACGGSIELWPPWLWLDPLCQLYSGPSATPAGPGWVFYQDLPSLKIQETKRKALLSLIHLYHANTFKANIYGSCFTMGIRYSPLNDMVHNGEGLLTCRLQGTVRKRLDQHFLTTLHDHCDAFMTRWFNMLYLQVCWVMMSPGQQHSSK